MRTESFSDSNYSKVVYILKNIPFCVKVIDDSTVQLRNKDFNLPPGIYCKFKYNIPKSAFIHLLKEQGIQNFQLCIPVYLEDTGDILWEKYLTVEARNFNSFSSGLCKRLSKSIYKI